jgi:hypothetical protein
MGKILRLRDTISRPSDATAYAAGDEVANSATAGSVVRHKFDLTGYTRGRITSACVDITPASGNVVITNLSPEVTIFKTPDAPAAVGDNVALSITGAQRSAAVGGFLFNAGAWKNPAGAFTAAASGFQDVPATVMIPLATALVVQHVPGFLFDFTGQKLSQRELTAVIQILAAWSPGTVVNVIGLTLDLEVE